MESNLIFKYCFILACFVSILSYVNVVESRGVNGGLGCAACTIVLGIGEQLAEIHNDTLYNISGKLCLYLPQAYQLACQEIADVLIPIVSSPELAEIATPDVICYGVGICHVDPGEQYCHLFPKTKNNFHDSVLKIQNAFERHTGFPSFDICTLPLVKDLCTAFYYWFEDMRPIVDLDGDGFSPMQVGRGSFWRGRDCLDINSHSYPGHGSPDYDETQDKNCNGIFGVNKKTGVPYEKELCQSSHRGVIIVGDSVCARFRFPEAWMDPTMIKKDVFINATDPLFDELDWPQLGWGIGFMNTSDPLLVQGTTDSIYLRMRERNLCVHRDYQNLCRNGDLTIDAIRSAKLISRTSNGDHPVLLIYNVIGNDVCNNAKDTLANMTTPTEYYDNVMGFLNLLPPRIPPDSHVILVGMVDGSFIYDAMSERYHPIGRLRKNVKYKDMYEWFTCTHIGPCNGWLTANETLRKATSVRSHELTEVLKNISSNHNFPFGVHYVSNPINSVVAELVKEGNNDKIWTLMEPVDSFHPNQYAQPLIAQTLWKSISQVAPEAIGSINPNNDKIRALFGDQGGH